MTYLLDTHCLLWSIGKSKELSGNARLIMLNSDNELFVSAVSLWEISIKYSIGKLVLEAFKPDDIPSYCNEIGIQLLPLLPHEAISYYKLKKYDRHNDPFDRMIINQAIQLKLILISRDRRMKLYKQFGLKVIW